jgi:hypothetical protein
LFTVRGQGGTATSQAAGTNFRRLLRHACLAANELYALYSSPNIIRVIKSRRLRWAGHVARMGERRGALRALVGKPEGRRPLGRPRRRWEDNIKWIFERVGGGAQTGLIWLRIGTGGGLLCIR